jgi:UDP-N-acetylmuramoyl-L-alanyl-D-glutamate--2,6-diaminopimelate ligase
MRVWRLGSLIKDLSARIVRDNEESPITGIQYDSRKVSEGDLFVALRGGYADGHAYLSEARERGATAALVEDDQPALAAGFPSIALTENTRTILSPVSARFFGYPGDKLGIVGITGTDGKTTTTYLVDAMLRANGVRTGMVGTVAIRVGDRLVEHDTRQTTPESLEVQRLLSDMADDQVEWAVLEATSHALALPRLNDCPFDVGIVTNVTREHLDFHGTVEAYREAKSQLIRRVEQGQSRPYPRGVVINLDDPGARWIGESTHLPVTWFSTDDRSATLYADLIEVRASGTSFRLHHGSDRTDVNLKLIGAYNVLNAMAAAGAGLALGLDLTQISAGLGSLDHVPGRMQRIDCGQPFNVIVDYAHSPSSVSATLDLVRAVTDGRVIIVMGSAGERDRGKRAVQGRIAAELAEFCIFTSEDPRFEDPDEIIREIAEGAMEAGAQSGSDFVAIENREDAIAHAVAIARSGDTILLAGKGHETSMIYDDTRRPWNEAQIVTEILERNGFAEQELRKSEGQT